MDSILQHLQDTFSLEMLTNLSATASTSFILIAAAEMGDKSQLVCMTLAARHRASPVILGATAAFAFLNCLAVLFGFAIANWLPDYVISVTVALLFAVFGYHSLFIENSEEPERMIEKSGRSIFFTTFLLITVAEFGDKTQLAVVALSSSYNPDAVWIGATIALAMTSTLGVIAGRTILHKFPIIILHKMSGIFFLLLAVAAAYNAYLNYHF